MCVCVSVCAREGSWWRCGAFTDLGVASGVQELVAAVTLEAQLVPVLPQ